MTSTAPLVSVVMPAYNSERYIEKAMRSVLCQTLGDLELIVVDDGSTDGTAKIVQSVAKQDGRVRLISQPNSGRPSIARNTGIAAARGEYLSFLDSDDYWLPLRVESLIDALKAHPEWLAVFHDLKLVDADENDLGGTYLGDAAFLTNAREWMTPLDGDLLSCNDRFFIFMSLKYAAVHTQSVMIDRPRFKTNDLLFDPSFVICEDTDLWIRIAMRGQLGFLNKVLSCYRQHGTSITRQRILFTSQAVEFHVMNFARIAPLMTLGEKRSYKLKIADYWRELGYLYYKNNNPSKSRGAYLKAFLINFSLDNVPPFCKTFIPSKFLDAVRQMSSH